MVNQCKIPQNVKVDIHLLFFTQLWPKYTFSESKFAVESISALYFWMWTRVKLLLGQNMLKNYKNNTCFGTPCILRLLDTWVFPYPQWTNPISCLNRCWLFLVSCFQLVLGIVSIGKLFYVDLICFTLYSFRVTLYNELNCMFLASLSLQLSKNVWFSTWYCLLNMILCILSENLGCNTKGPDLLTHDLYHSDSSV